MINLKTSASPIPSWPPSSLGRPLFRPEIRFEENGENHLSNIDALFGVRECANSIFLEVQGYLAHEKTPPP